MSSQLPANPAAEAAVLGACLLDPDRVIEIADKLQPDDFHIQAHRLIAEAVWKCVDERTPPTYGAVVDQLQSAHRWTTHPNGPSTVCQADLTAIMNATTELDISHVSTNAGIVVDTATRRRGYDTTNKVAGLFIDQSLTLGEVQSRVNMALGKVFDQRGRDGSIAIIASEEEQRLARLVDGEQLGISCGIDWLDTRTGGFLPAENWVISGAYKMRKTSLALNFVLNVAETGHGVSIFTNGDSTRDATFRKLAAMVMNRAMFGDGRFNTAVSSRTLQVKLNNALYEELRQKAFAHLRGLRIYLYDGRDLIGNLNETARKLRRDVAVNGVDLFVYDYAQTVQHGADDYAKTTFYAGWCQNITGELGIAGITLSQRSESAINNTEETYSPGTKGGGALPAMANVLLETKYSEPLLTVTLKLSRESGTCKPVQHKVNPQSGLILDKDFIIR